MKIYNLFFLSYIFLFFTYSIAMEKTSEKAHGQEVYANFMSYIKNQESEDNQKKLIKIAASNLVGFGIHKALHSKEEISQELKSEGYMSKIIAYCGSCIISWLVDFDAVSENIDKVKQEMAEVLQKSYENFSKVKKNPDKYLWVMNEIKPFVPKTKKDRKMLVDILCADVHIAKNNELMFKKFLSMGKVGENIPRLMRVLASPSSLRNIFYNQISSKEFYLEKKIYESCFKGYKSDNSKKHFDMEDIPDAESKCLVM